ncbi:MAG: helix-turn-helix domain-containing protein [Hyphomicrobiales bacterium]|nr:helix-turn-helix domain-containing protein [Hyphomicrobiales bacterium]
MCAATSKMVRSASRPRKPPGVVPVFSLYGEADAVAPEFIHIEDIRSRSERYGWEIAEHRHHGLFQLLLLIEGAARVRVDHATRDVCAPFAIAMPSGVAHAFRFERGTRGFVLTIEESMFARASGAQGPHAALMNHPALVDLSRAADQSARLVALFEQIAQEFREGGRATGAVLQWLASAALVLVLRQNEQLAREKAGGAQEAADFHRFRALVEEKLTEHWPIARFSRELGLSESRLNRACRLAAGKSALEVVQDRLTLEARRRLIHVAGPVGSLAWELGFEDPAYFWRFFRRRTGMTPNEFRRRHEDAT